MFNAYLYQPVYLILVTLLTIITSSKYFQYSSNRISGKENQPIFGSLLICLFFAIFIGLRPVHGVFMDMLGTAQLWWCGYFDEGVFSFSLNRENFLYDNMRVFLCTAGVSVEMFFLLMAIIYFFCAYFACRRLFPKDTLLAFLVLLGAFSTFSYGTNGVKSGAAASIFLLAISFQDKPTISFLLAVISWGMHHSMIMVLCSYLIVFFINRNPKWYFGLWIFSFVIAAAHITAFQEFFGSMADEQGQGYLLAGETGGELLGSGFRIDFILYSSMPVLVGYFAIFRKKISSIKYNILLNLYLMTNSIWMLCMYAEFTNRVAYLSWFLYPIVLIYPFLNENWGANQYRTASLVAIAHLGFTLVMYAVYHY